jgi:hypothetical protein
MNESDRKKREGGEQELSFPLQLFLMACLITSRYANLILPAFGRSFLCVIIL